MYTIVFRPEGGQEVKLQAAEGENILALAVKGGVVIDAPCSGNGVCGKCRLRLIAGTVDMTKVPSLSEEEYEDGWRLACQSRVMGDATFLVPAGASAFQSGIQTADLSSAQELAAYEKAIDGIFGAGIPRGTAQKGVGLAVDIGTTTCAAALLDLQSGAVLAKASAGNGQIRYGADVINRIIQSTKPGGREKLRRAVREETLIPLIETLCRGANVESTDITRAVIAGNTTMEHLFAGVDAESIRLEPYVPAFLALRGETAERFGLVTAKDFGLPLCPEAPVILAPNVGSYVGGDITAGALTSMIWDADELTLFIDLGTNGELVFGSRDFLLCCACSAGPAFEGGDITCGMRATKGAIEACRIDEESMEPVFEIVGGDLPPAGLCGSGLIDTISELFRCGIINGKGKFVREGRRVVRSEYEAAYVLAFAEESASGRDVTLTETDIDNFIRAKGAIFSAIRAMLNSLDMTVDCITKVIVAGGIGSGIDIPKAISIGMLPALPVEKYSYIGNSSLTGACAMLLSDEAEEKVFALGDSMTYLELSSHPGYMDEFVAACFLPHTQAELFDMAD